MERMLTIYRLHSAKCPHKGKGRAHTKCACPIWIDGTLKAMRYHKSAKTRNWTVANRRALDIEITGAPPEPAPITPPLLDCIERFHADQEARGLTDSSRRKYRQTTDRLAELARIKGCHSPRQIDLAMLREMREAWTDSGVGHAKHLERLRQIFRFFAANGWIASNPATSLKAPKIKVEPTLPLEPLEIASLIAACDSYPFASEGSRRRARAYVLTLRYTGLRLGDSVRLHSSQIDVQGRVTVSTAKTGQPVKVLIPSFLVTALEAIRQPDGYFFRAGSGEWHSQETGWWRRLKKLAAHAGVANVHPHRFRDTFAVELLKAGESIETVSRLLGHNSIRITEKHYNAWVVSRQDALDQAMLRTFAASNPHQEKERTWKT